MNLYGKVVIVTGASQGIGKVLCQKLLNLDAKVIGVYNTHELNDDYIDYVKCDIANEEEIKSLYNYVLKKYHHVDYLVNGAALCLDNDIEDKTKDEFMKVLEVNLVGTFLMCKYALEKMMLGTIINISSTDATDTFSVYSMDYAASKAGIENLTKSLAKRYPKNRIMALAPAWVNTDTVLEMNPDYLKKEMEQHHQDKLLNKEDVADRIIEMLIDSKYQSGNIYRMDK